MPISIGDGVGVLDPDPTLGHSTPSPLDNCATLEEGGEFQPQVEHQHSHEGMRREKMFRQK
jgi:hypothetical protein